MHCEEYFVLKSTMETLFILILIIEFKLLLDSLDLISALMNLKWLKHFSRVVFENGAHLQSSISNIIGFQSSLPLPNLHNWGWLHIIDVKIVVGIMYKFGVARTLRKLIRILALIYTFHRFHGLRLIAVII